MQTARRFRFLLILLATIGGFTVQTAEARSAADEVQTIWRLLDYLAVDYGGAVANGEVASTVEYAEMTEFSATVRKGIATLPASPARAGLVAEAGKLEAAIASKSDPGKVAGNARGLAADLLAAYPVPLAPRKAPDPLRGAQVFLENCASCHGSRGDGKGPQAKGLDPAPIDFTDIGRARKRSLFALYQVIGQGLEGTSMPSFAQLPSDDRWAVAAYAGGFAFRDVSTGQQIWDQTPSARKLVPDLQAFTSLSPEALGRTLGTKQADALTAYLRSNPKALSAASPAKLAVARDKLVQSVAAYRKGERDEAERLALSAYLDGFEPVEPILTTRDSALMARIESAMADYRVSIARGLPVDVVAGKASTVEALFADAEAALSPDAASDASTFVGALTILLREGLEALLIVVAMIAFLRKAERPEVLSYVHGGWIAALVAGGATWAVATYAISVSGANRELTEGFGSLFAAVVLVWVGIWMHGKSHANSWQRYIRDAMGKALSRRSAWFLFGLAFLVVYREVFETILFFTALATQGSSGAIAAGAGTALVILAAIAWVMLRYSRVLPIGKFFAYSSVLIAILAVVLAGKGAGALQEAGLLGITPLAHFPRFPAMGIFPSLEPLLLQLLALAVLWIGYRYNSRQHRRIETAPGR
ncbi:MULTISPECIES: cytochrome c/FTR1 family iron permease [unclassified Sphingopyxis]|jgi:high-affinity iron transporter|uniref:cytochrome c/FTR1 family iron permease n=1 Tax=unclassified Sphingopyxis TaxID=2614943 RepID=UPI0007317770|nr:MULTISPECIES: cytochrome c/FTR1 family iron permease [unclassified Sphingopyxis]MBN8844622.1 cytochrome c/FTR1 family iron permease [Sphingomonadales bacterium]KTE23477.1 iron permease [Sphingopyxis sp. H057]KTE49885.1 iron permease [Sphingopyxis sp. H073]KTE50291.1 iron permease [Sphingopyxis sp. H071]KTE58554.1 iron permease [Sphingopyxis sp. H107]